MIPRDLHRYPGICPKTGKPQKTSTRRLSDEGDVRPIIASNGVPFLQLRSVGSHSTSGWYKKGKKGWEEVGRINSQRMFNTFFLNAKPLQRRYDL
jgi:hypothetical protein